jgi:hypothetical protein
MSFWAEAGAAATINAVANNHSTKAQFVILPPLCELQ